jgi:hypothetical protein
MRAPAKSMRRACLVALMPAPDLSSAPSQVTGILRRSVWPFVAVGSDLAFRLVAAPLQR